MQLLQDHTRAEGAALARAVVLEAHVDAVDAQLEVGDDLRQQARRGRLALLSVALFLSFLPALFDRLRGYSRRENSP